MARRAGDQQVYEASEQADVLSGNDQQMDRAGVLQHLPIFATQPGAIAKDQCHQRPGAPLGIDLRQRLANSVAPGAPSRLQESPLLDATGRTNAAAQQPRPHRAGQEGAQRLVQDAGFAIFLHLNQVPTAGCISLDDWAVVDGFTICNGRGWLGPSRTHFIGGGLHIVSG